MRLAQRVARHLRITKTGYEEAPSPPFLVLFVTSLCNMKCDHCFYWRSLNKKNDLTTEQWFDLSRSLGRVENLNISGGEPFIRKDLAEICRQFIRQNGVRQIYVPTNGYFTEWTVEKTCAILEEPELELLVVELSLEGMPHFHDAFRGTKNAFRNAIQTYDALAELQRVDPRLRIHAVSVATHTNLEEIKRLSTYLYERCPRIDHHNLAIIRGDRKDPSLEGPALDQYMLLYEYIRRLWSPREKGRYGAMVEPLLQWAKVKTIREKGRGFSCTAGRLSGVVYANGDVALCEGQKPVGNLREASFGEIWRSTETEARRKAISETQCYCTTEVFMWPGIVHQPSQLARAMWGAKVWKRPKPLGPGERVPVVMGPDGLPMSDPLANRPLKLETLSTE